MTTFRDFIVWYNNNLDVVPFLEAIDKMSNFWKERNIDIFKDGVSVPGLSMKYLFSNIPGTYFSLFSDKDKDIYYSMKDNNVGGPRIIFNRYHEKEKLFIREVEARAKGRKRVETLHEGGWIRCQCALLVGHHARHANGTVHKTNGGGWV